MIGYAVPGNRFHEFNVMAEAEWTWNAQGRTPEEFARAYAVAQGMRRPRRVRALGRDAGSGGLGAGREPLAA